MGCSKFGVRCVCVNMYTHTCICRARALGCRYVECRAAFPNLDAVQELLVHRVAALAMFAHRLVRGHHSKKTHGFVKACLAYCHVTAPSATGDVLKRLDLTLLCAQVALANGCLPQTDTFLKGCISLVPDVPLTEEVRG